MPVIYVIPITDGYEAKEIFLLKLHFLTLQAPCAWRASSIHSLPKAHCSTFT